MKHKPLHTTRFFFATPPLPCPYIPGKMERRVVSELVGRDASILHYGLSMAGFRRSHSIAYAPACPDCTACVAVRVVVGDFIPSRSQRRVRNRNREIQVMELPARATEEQFTLFGKYQSSRHDGGDMEKMDFQDYLAMVEDTPVETVLVEFRDGGGDLIGVCLSDFVVDGMSAVYSFFDPTLHRQSLGTFMIMWLIEKARGLNLENLYLGFWIADCSKMEYKKYFQPLQGHTPEGWRTLNI